MKSNMNLKIKNSVLIYRIIVSILFVYIFIQFLTMKRTNAIYRFYTDYIMNKYCIILYLLIVILITKYDKFTAVLLIILIIAPFKCAIKEFFIGTNDVINPTTTIPYGTDDRFKMDEIAKNTILKQIKSQIDFDPYKTNLDKTVIYEINNKYFDNDIFIKIKNINEDRQQYIAESNFK